MKKVLSLMASAAIAGTFTAFSTEAYNSSAITAVRIVEHGISRENANHANVVEVKSLCDHLSTNKQVCLL